ncbi:MAG: YbjN domain-containing protein [Oscillospiraceae bacterium]|nr:YbjN domain-containing protein [Oscillospiraceae bacterium]
MYEMEREVRNFLDEGKMHYLYQEDAHAFLMGVEMDEDAGECMMAITAHDEEDLSCHIIYKDNVPEKSRMEIVKYITRANYGLFLGSFQMNMEDGQIVYQVGTVHSDHVVFKEEIARMIHVAEDMVRRYSKGFRDVIDGVCSPEEAVEQAEREDLFGDICDEFFSPDHAEVDNNDYGEMIAVMTEEQLDFLIDAVGNALAGQLGVKKKICDIPEEYIEVVDGLSGGELLMLKIILLRERFHRMGLDDVQEEEEQDFQEMSEEEKRRRMAASFLKESLRERLVGSEHKTE